jgi:PD-(D/E)XK endonuclease
MFNGPRSKPRKTTRKTKPRKNTKITGERSEAAFLHRASNLGFGVAKPWGDSRRYDFILDNGACLYRIQVKCTESIRARAYETRATYTVGKGRAVYTRADVDFLAAHVVPLDIWYILPVEVCTPAPMLRFYPHRTAKKMRLEPYREAWHLLQSPDDEEKMDNAGKPRRGLEIQASADEALYSETARVGTDAFVRPAGQSPAVEFANLTWLTPRPTKPVVIARLDERPSDNRSPERGGMR